jgi:hypothetical protein
MRKVFFERALPLTIIAVTWTGWGYAVYTWAAPSLVLV